MHIVIETEDLVADQLTSRKNGQVYFTLEQPALMFTDDSQYPRHFNLRLAFEIDKAKRDSIGPIAKGKYQLSDKAFKIGRFGDVELNINASTLKPYAPSSATAIPTTRAA